MLCYAVSHTSHANPLRTHDGLHGICGVEYAAQGMALHARLSGVSGPSGGGMLASVRNLRLYVDRLEDCGERIWIETRRLGGSAQGFVYDFEVRAATTVLLSGRAAVMVTEGDGP